MKSSNPGPSFKRSEKDISFEVDAVVAGDVDEEGIEEEMKRVASWRDLNER
jgi:hypothetical protein